MFCNLKNVFFVLLMNSFCNVFPAKISNLVNNFVSLNVVDNVVSLRIGLDEINFERNSLILDFYDGDGFVVGYFKAFEWYLKAAGECDVARQLKRYADGSMDYQKKAFELFWQAAKKGDVAAQINLGFCYGGLWGVREDNQKAFKWFLKAAKTGHAGAQDIVGCHYLGGVGVETNNEEGIEWLMKSAKQGLTVAQFNLGLNYDGGIGVARNFKKAAQWLLRAAEQGFAEAQYLLGVHYEYGLGVRKNFEKATKWYLKAARQGLRAWKRKKILSHDAAVQLIKEQLKPIVVKRQRKQEMPSLTEQQKEQDSEMYDANFLEEAIELGNELLIRRIINDYDNDNKMNISIENIKTNGNFSEPVQIILLPFLDQMRREFEYLPEYGNGYSSLSGYYAVHAATVFSQNVQAKRDLLVDLLNNRTAFEQLVLIPGRTAINNLRSNGDVDDSTKLFGDEIVAILPQEIKNEVVVFGAAFSNANEMEQLFAQKVQLIDDFKMLKRKHLVLVIQSDIDSHWYVAMFCRQEEPRKLQIIVADSFNDNCSNEVQELYQLFFTQQKNGNEAARLA